MAPRALKRTGIVAGVAAGAVGLAYATERALVARLRHREDPDAGLPLVPEYDAMPRPRQSRRRHDLHHLAGRRAAGGVLPRGHALVARLGEAVRVVPRRRVPRGGLRLPRARRVGGRRHRPLDRQPGRRPSQRARGARPARRGAGRALDGRDGGAGLRHPSPGRAARARVRVGAAVDLVAQPGERRPPRARGARTARRASVPTSPRSCVPATSGSCWHGSASATTRTRATSRRPARCSRRAAVTRPAPPPPRCSASTSPRDCRRSTCRPSCWWGAPTRSTPPRDSRRIVDLVPGARLVEYPGAGHMLMYERTEAVDALDHGVRAPVPGRRRRRRRARRELRRLGRLT